MNKFNENVSIEETSEYQIGELMNEVNNDIEVGDKVQWNCGGLHGNETITDGIVVDIGNIYCICKFSPESGVPSLGIFLRNGSQADGGNCSGYLELIG